MKAKLILPALTEARSPYWRPIKYSLFPPLGLATLAAHLSPDDDTTLIDEHVEKLKLDDQPDLVVIRFTSPTPTAATGSRITTGRRGRTCASAGCT